MSNINIIRVWIGIVRNIIYIYSIYTYKISFGIIACHFHLSLHLFSATVISHHLSIMCFLSYTIYYWRLLNSLYVHPTIQVGFHCILFQFYFVFFFSFTFLFLHHTRPHLIPTRCHYLICLMFIENNMKMFYAECN